VLYKFHICRRAYDLAKAFAYNKRGELKGSIAIAGNPVDSCVVILSANKRCAFFIDQHSIGYLFKRPLLIESLEYNDASYVRANGMSLEYMKAESVLPEVKCTTELKVKKLTYDDMFKIKEVTSPTAATSFGFHKDVLHILASFKEDVYITSKYYAALGHMFVGFGYANDSTICGLLQVHEVNTPFTSLAMCRKTVEDSK